MQTIMKTIQAHTIPSYGLAIEIDMLHQWAIEATWPSKNDWKIIELIKFPPLVSSSEKPGVQHTTMLVTQGQAPPVQ